VLLEAPAVPAVVQVVVGVCFHRRFRHSFQFLHPKVG
jgi:hypothetical protein